MQAFEKTGLAILHRKADIARILRANQIGCFVIAAVLVLFIGAIVYISLTSPAENMSNAVIPVSQ